MQTQVENQKQYHIIEDLNQTVRGLLQNDVFSVCLMAATAPNACRNNQQLKVESPGIQINIVSVRDSGSKSVLSAYSAPFKFTAPRRSVQNNRVSCPNVPL